MFSLSKLAGLLFHTVLLINGRGEEYFWGSCKYRSKCNIVSLQRNCIIRPNRVFRWRHLHTDDVQFFPPPLLNIFYCLSTLLRPLASESRAACRPSHACRSRNDTVAHIVKTWAYFSNICSRNTGLLNH